MTSGPEPQRPSGVEAPSRRVRFEFRPDCGQRRVIYEGIAQVREWAGCGTVTAIAEAALCYPGLHAGDTIACPSRTAPDGRRTATMVRHFDPFHASILDEALALGLQNGCLDRDHALAHIFDTFLLFEGVVGPCGAARLGGDGDVA